MPAIDLPRDMQVSDALKVDSLAGRIIGDLGSIWRRIKPDAYEGACEDMPAELAALRAYVRAVQDACRDRHPDAFFK